MKKKLEESGRKNIFLKEFIREMDLAYCAADLIISRAGAGTISELAIVAKPVILVPSPNVAEDHQTQNAMALVNRDAAVMVRDAEVNEKLLAEADALLRDEMKGRKLSENLKKLAIPDSADRIAAEIIKLMKK